MNDLYYQKYIKYKNKYINLNLYNNQKLNNKIGGVVEGFGSAGIVVSNPCLPFHCIIIKKSDLEYKLRLLTDEETIKEKILVIEQQGDNFNLVSKLFKKKEKCLDEYTNYDNLLNKYSEIFTDDKYILPLGCGIAKSSTVEYMMNTISNWSLKRDGQNLTEELKKNYLLNEYIWHIRFNKGESINYNLLDFVIKMLPILHSVKETLKNKLFFEDLKLDNIIKHDDSIKIIDFSSIIDANDKINLISNITNSNIKYTPCYLIYNPIYQYLLDLDLIPDEFESNIIDRIIDGIICMITSEYNIREGTDRSYLFNNLNGNLKQDYIFQSNNLNITKFINYFEIIYGCNLENIIMEEDKLNNYKHKLKIIIIDILKKLNGFTQIDKKIKLLEFLQLYMIGIIFLTYLFKIFNQLQMPKIEIIDIYIQIINICYLPYLQNSNILYNFDTLICYIHNLKNKLDNYE